MTKIKDFYESQDWFKKWREQNTSFSASMGQCFDENENILVEKWCLWFDGSEDPIMYFVEIYNCGNGFALFKRETSL